jgi:N utilization substance protein A
LNGEKIDIINWSEQPEILVSRSLSPAKPVNLLLMEDKPYIMAVFSDEELPTAIGRNGQNILLASQVTGYTIDAVKQSEYEGPKRRTIYLDELEGMRKTHIEILGQVDIHTAREFMETPEKDILALKGFGPKTYEQVKSVIAEAQNAAEEEVKKTSVRSPLKSVESNEDEVENREIVGTEDT